MFYVIFDLFIVFNFLHSIYKLKSKDGQWYCQVEMMISPLTFYLGNVVKSKALYSVEPVLQNK